MVKFFTIFLFVWLNLFWSNILLFLLIEQFPFSFLFFSHFLMINFFTIFTFCVNFICALFSLIVFHFLKKLYIFRILFYILLDTPPHILYIICITKRRAVLHIATPYTVCCLEFRQMIVMSNLNKGCEYSVRTKFFSCRP